MKVLVNGGINLSELDGWWAEAYMPEVGWAFGDGQEHGDDPSWDAAEAAALYDLLEREVIPEFYARHKRGIPTDWVARMRESMAQLTTQFSANRAVREYTEQRYIPTATAYRKRALDKGAVGAQVVNWQRNLEQKWAALRFGEVKVVSDEGQHLFDVEVYLGGLDPDSVRVELYADGVNGGAPGQHEMTRSRGQRLTDANGYIYSVQVPATRPATDYTASYIGARQCCSPLGGRSNPMAAAGRLLWAGGIGIRSTQLTNMPSQLVRYSIWFASWFRSGNQILRLQPHLGYAFVRFSIAQDGL